MNERNCGLCIPCALGKYDECETVQELHPEISLEARVTELESQLTAEREARQKAEEDVKKFMALSKANEKLAEIAQHRADRAEARIKASHEQEPAFVIHDELGNTHNLYKQPPIPPELSEVVRERDELRRKLAEQQAWRQSLVSMDNRGEPDSFIVDCLVSDQTDGASELTKLLEEAKRQAVPEGMVLLPISCPECGGKDIEYARMCHNSKCKAYAMEFSVYEGWRSAAPQPHKD